MCNMCPACLSCAVSHDGSRQCLITWSAFFFFCGCFFYRVRYCQSSYGFQTPIVYRYRYITYHDTYVCLTVFKTVDSRVDFSVPSPFRVSGLDLLNFHHPFTLLLPFQDSADLYIRIILPFPPVPPVFVFS